MLVHFPVRIKGPPPKDLSQVCPVTVVNVCRVHLTLQVKLVPVLIQASQSADIVQQFSRQVGGIFPKSRIVIRIKSRTGGQQGQPGFHGHCMPATHSLLGKVPEHVIVKVLIDRKSTHLNYRHSCASCMTTTA